MHALVRGVWPALVDSPSNAAYSRDAQVSFRGAHRVLWYVMGVVVGQQLGRHRIAALDRGSPAGSTLALVFFFFSLVCLLGRRARLTVDVRLERQAYIFCHARDRIDSTQRAGV